jgi:NADH-quinone oxidoreductase subunit F
MDYEGLRERGSLVGSGGFIVIGDNVSAVDCLLNLAHFYMHESCGQCTPCREGCGWIEQLLRRVKAGVATRAELEKPLWIADAMAGKTICALADALAWPTVAFMKKYPEDFAVCMGESVDLDALAAGVAKVDHILPRAS